MKKKFSFTRYHEWKKTSGSPRYSTSIIKTDTMIAFTKTIEDHIGLIPNGNSPSLNQGPCQYRIKTIIHEYYDMSSIIHGNRNVSQSPKKTLEKLKKIKEMAFALSKEISEIGMCDPDTDEALFCSIQLTRDDTKDDSDPDFIFAQDTTNCVNFIGIAAHNAIEEILKFKENGKKLSHWPCYVEAEQKLIMYLADIYHYQKGDPRKHPWETAGAACRNTGSDTKEYSGPFFDMVLDCFDVLGIEKAQPTPKNPTNRLLGEYIKRALKKWKELHAQGLSISM